MSRLPTANVTLAEALREWRDNALTSEGVLGIQARTFHVERIVRRIELLGKASNKMRASEAEDIKLSLDRLLRSIETSIEGEYSHEDALVIAIAAYSLTPITK